MKLRGYSRHKVYGETVLVPEGVRWFAIDANGYVTGFITKPAKEGNAWNGYGAVVTHRVSFEDGDIDWKETLLHI